MWPQPHLPPLPMMSEKNQQSKLPEAKEKFTDDHQWNSAGAETTSGGYHSPEDEKQESHQYQQALRRQLEAQDHTIRILMCQKTELETALYYSQDAARKFEEESKDLAGCLHHSWNFARELQRALSAVSTQHKKADRMRKQEEEMRKQEEQMMKQEEHMRDLEGQMRKQEEEMRKQEEQMRKQEEQMRKQEERMRKQEEQMWEQDKQMQKQEEQMQEQEEQMRKQEEQMQEKEEQMQKQEQMRKQEEQMCELEEQMRMQEEQMREQDERLRFKEERLWDQDEKMQEEEEKMRGQVEEKMRGQVEKMREKERTGEQKMQEERCSEPCLPPSEDLYDTSHPGSVKPAREATEGSPDDNCTAQQIMQLLGGRKNAQERPVLGSTSCIPFFYRGDKRKMKIISI
ncbi:GOLGA6L1 isoform 1 [Pongo abelii]|uniref:GOLGA6L1 isoform 1 n=1 Tax=Pongo abelii TaxID=9601 RepID=A0A2J8QZ23_PONAB|nr:GOLGA6L1 isoform 1 [Pongo abelii]